MLGGDPESDINYYEASLINKINYYKSVMINKITEFETYIKEEKIIYDNEKSNLKKDYNDAISNGFDIDLNKLINLQNEYEKAFNNSLDSYNNLVKIIRSIKTQVDIDNANKLIIELNKLKEIKNVNKKKQTLKYIFLQINKKLQINIKHHNNNILKNVKQMMIMKN